MTAVKVALIAALVLTAAAVLPTAYVLLREALRRVGTRRARGLIERARAVAESGGGANAAAIAAELRRRFRPVVVERVVVGLLTGEDAGKTELAAQLFAHTGLLVEYTRRVREARSWSERAHAATILGKAGSPAAAPALVAVLRDRYEDEGSVKAAATSALASLKDPAAVPILVKELGTVDERSSPTVAEALVGFGELAIEPLVAALDASPTAQGRVWAARVLGRIGSAAATTALVARLHDRHDLLRVAVAEALGAVGDRRALQPLVQATLRDPAAQVRAHAAAAVARIEGASAVDVLVAALADPDYATRVRALEAFENVQLVDTAPLEKALHDPSLEVRKRAALALERVGFLDRVIDALAQEDPELAARAYAQLIELGRAGLVDGVVAYVHHASFQVRAQIARACGELGVTRTGPLLVAAVDDPAWPVRAALAAAIGALKVEKAAPALAKLLVDAEEPVREAAAQALAGYAAADLDPLFEEIVSAYQRGNVPIRLQMVRLGARVERPEIAQMLVVACTDPSESVRLAAVRALADRPEDVAVRPLVARLTDTSLEVRIAAVTALGSAASTEAFEGLMRALPGAPPHLRDRLAEALARGGRAHMFAQVDVLLSSPDRDVRLGVAWTLGKMADPACVPALTRLLADHDAGLRASAAGALAKIETPASLDALLAAASDREPKTRAAVANAVARLGKGDPRAFAALEARLTDPDPFLRDRAAVGLARVAADPEIAAGVLARHASRIDAAALTVAEALLGTEAGFATAMSRLANPEHLARVEAFVAHEGESVRAELYGRLGLEAKAASGEERALDEASLVAHYETALRTSLEASARRRAVEALSRLHGVRILEILADALGSDPEAAVRVRAVEALGESVDDSRARDALVRAVADPVPAVAIVAVRALSRVRTPRVVSALFARLGTARDEVSGAVEQALAALHQGDLPAFLDRMMGSDVPESIAASIRVVARIGDPGANPLLRELARSAHAGIRVAVADAAATIGGPGAPEILDGLLGDPHEAVRLAALDAMVVDDGASLMRVAPLRSDPAAKVRARLATRLAGVDGAVAAKLLDALVEDSSPRVRAAALASLLWSGDPEALRRFAAAWPKAALDTRRELGAEPRAADLAQRLASLLRVSPSAQAREVAVSGLAALASPGYAALVLPALQDPSAEVRIAAVRALAPVEDAAVRARLSDLLRDPEPAVRDAARRSLLRSVSR